MQNKKRYPNPKGRTDLGVAANDTGAYTAVVGEDESGRAKTVTVYRMRNIRDGMVRDFTYDGWGRGGVPLSGTQNLLNVMRKRHDVFEGDEEVGYPMFFLDKRVARQFDSINGIPVPVATKEVREEMERCVDKRNKRRARSAAEYQAERMTAQVARLEAEAAARKAMDNA